MPRNTAGSDKESPLTPLTEDTTLEHELKNQVAIILGFAELLLEDLPAGDPHLDDVREIRKAAAAAAALLHGAAKPSA